MTVKELNSKKEIHMEDNLYQDWLEFEVVQIITSSNGSYITEFFANFKKSEIVAVLDDADKNRYKDRCSILLKNGKRYIIKMSYNKVMELVLNEKNSSISQ